MSIIVYRLAYKDNAKRQECINDVRETRKSKIQI